MGDPYAIDRWRHASYPGARRSSARWRWGWSWRAVATAADACRFPAPTAAVGAAMARDQHAQPAPSLHDLPASHDRPAYGLPLVIKIERIPEVPERIKGPMKKEVGTRGQGQ